MIIEDYMIVTMKIPLITKPRRGEINAIPSGLVSYFIANFCNPYTPLGFVNRSMIRFYNINTPLGLKQ
jgi:hypothetical protein